MDLTARYLGLELRNPLVASASPLSYTAAGVRRLADAGVGAVVLHSLFQEELERDAERHGALLEAGSESFPEARSYFPDAPWQGAAPRRYLDVLERAAAAAGVPVLASLNGATPEGWTAYARQLQDAGAAAIELNLYAAPPDPEVSGREVEDRHVEIVRLVRGSVEIPVAVKMSPFYSSVGEMASRFGAAGADGLVLFNRFLHPDIDPDALAVVPGLGLSTPGEGRLPRTWLAVLRRRTEVSLAASTGVEGPADLARCLLAGADVVMTTSALLRHGPGHATTLIAGLDAWMEQKGFRCLDEVRGKLAEPAGSDRSASQRASYVAALTAANATTHHPW